MPISTPNFAVSQTIGAANAIIITDTSVGSDVAVTGRRVFLQKADSSFLVPAGTTTAYIDWTIDLTSITIDALDKDYSLNITVNWVDVNGNTLYTKTTLTIVTLYLNTFFYSLTQLQTSDPNIVSDTNYYANKTKLWCCILEAVNANDLAGDIYSAQSALDRGNLMVQNEQSYF